MPETTGLTPSAVADVLYMTGASGLDVGFFAALDRHWPAALRAVAMASGFSLWCGWTPPLTRSRKVG